MWPLMLSTGLCQKIKMAFLSRETRDVRLVLSPLPPAFHFLFDLFSYLAAGLKKFGNYIVGKSDYFCCQFVLWLLWLCPETLQPERLHSLASSGFLPSLESVEGLLIFSSPGASLLGLLRKTRSPLSMRNPQTMLHPISCATGDWSRKSHGEGTKLTGSRKTSKGCIWRDD